MPRPAVTAVTRAQLAAQLPAPWPEDLRPALREARAGLKRKVVVLDDDPTGTQSVHGVAVLTRWSREALAAELRGDAPAFYLLTNSRSLPAAQAQRLNREIAGALRAASVRTGVGFTLVSRADSTLRGHYPAETDALAEVLRFAATFLVPAFLEGGRYTAGDTHYLEAAGALIPVSQTPFAQDATFGYRHADLRAWVEEKTRGRVRALEVASLGLSALRAGPEGVLEALLALPPGVVCVVNALDARDLEVFGLALTRAEAQGRRYLLRSAASLVPVLAALPPKPLLTPEAFASTAAGGLVVVGSHVPASSAQLRYLLEHSGVAGTQARVERLLAPGGWGEVARARGALEAALGAGRDALLYTSRGVVKAADPEVSLSLSRRVSRGLVAVVQGLRAAPRFVIAKGGVTSSDVATGALGVVRATVLGQLLPGVPVWQLGAESRYPGLPYVVFPGNVGADDALYEAYRRAGGAA